jgi:ATP-binding cassette, subfamily B (MDR/TAP), member 1
MTLFMGNLAQGFVTFTIALQVYQASPGSDNLAELDSARASFKHAAANNSANITYVGIGMFVATYIYRHSWAFTSEVNSKRIRKAYLRAVLRQDIAFFDNVSPGEIATHIQADTRKRPRLSNYLTRSDIW